MPKLVQAKILREGGLIAENYSNNGAANRIIVMARKKIDELQRCVISVYKRTSYKPLKPHTFYLITIFLESVCP